MKSRSLLNNCYLPIHCSSATGSWLLSEHTVFFSPVCELQEESLVSFQGEGQGADMKNNTHFIDLLKGLNAIIRKVLTIQTNVETLVIRKCLINGAMLIVIDKNLWKQGTFQFLANIKFKVQDLQ